MRKITVEVIVGVDEVGRSLVRLRQARGEQDERQDAESDQIRPQPLATVGPFAPQVHLRTLTLSAAAVL